jgi:hypothetical protein
MISDALSEFVERIDDYLNKPDFDRTYEGELRDRIVRLRNEAEYLRRCSTCLPMSNCRPNPCYWSGSTRNGVGKWKTAAMYSRLKLKPSDGP